MKITRTPTGPGTLGLINSLVIIDDYHRKNLGLDYLADSCVISHEVPTDLHTHPAHALAFVDSRPEVFESHLTALDLEGYLSSHTVWCVFPKNQAHLISWILNQPAVQGYAVRDIIVTHQVIAVEIGLCQVDDLEAEVYFQGMRFGMVLAGTDITATATDYSREIELRNQLVALLSNVDLLATEQPKNSKQTQATQAAEALNHKNKLYIAELEGRIVTLQSKLDALQRKYDALANSKVGKLVLGRWDRNRNTTSGAH